MMTDFTGTTFGSTSACVAVTGFVAGIPAGTGRGFRPVDLDAPGDPRLAHVGATH